VSERALHARARRAALTVVPAALAAAVAVSAVPMTVTTEPSASAATSASPGRVPFQAFCISLARACGTPVARSTASSSAAAPPARSTVTPGSVRAPCFSEMVSILTNSTQGI